MIALVISRIARTVSLVMAFAVLACSPLIALAQQADPNAPPAEPTIKVSYMAYFLTVLAIVLGLVIMLRPGTRSEPEGK